LDKLSLLAADGAGEVADGGGDVASAGGACVVGDETDETGEVSGAFELADVAEDLLLLGKLADDVTAAAAVVGATDGDAGDTAADGVGLTAGVVAVLFTLNLLAPGAAARQAGSAGFSC
jgi:hypothetical protein